MSLEVTNISSYETLNSLVIEKKAILFYGETLDNRSQDILDFFSERTEKEQKILYNEETFKVQINDKTYRNIEFENKYIKNLIYDLYYLDATSLGFAELLLILHNLNRLHKNKNKKIKIIYAEPKEYKRGENKEFQDEFDLTTSSGKFQKIPPYSLLIDSTSSEKAILIPFLGFENNRLGRILESDDGARYEKYIPILALPAFEAGWENISLRRHYEELKNTNSIRFSPANNPYEMNKVLDRIYKNERNKNLVLAPIGTKPHAIGAIIFLINKEEKNIRIGLTYDFPKKKDNRTDGIGNIYEYTLKIK